MWSIGQFLRDVIPARRERIADIVEDGNGASMNDHVVVALDEYLDAERLPVPHAFLVEGPWGSGKTHFLRERYEKEYANRRARARLPHVPFVFVSLFGVTSAEDLERRLFRAANPAEAAVGSVIGTLALAAGGVFRMADGVKEGRDKLLRKSMARLAECVFVFDDLERIDPAALGEVMGSLNDLVEKHGRRVILVADEEKITDVRFPGAEWDLRNEKIVGRRVRVEPPIKDVVDDFIARDLGDPNVRELLSDFRERIDRTVAESKMANLRNLRWALHNAAAVALHLKEVDDVPHSHLESSVLVTLAATLEMREHGIDLKGLAKVPHVGMDEVLATFRQRRGADEEVDASSAAARAFVDRYGSLKLMSPPLDYQIIHDLERRGVLDHEELRRWIGEQFSFGEEFAEPSWRRLWHGTDRPVGETERALSCLAAELQQEKHVEYGVILHCVGLALNWRDAGDRTLTNGEEIVAFFKRYIDGLASAGRLPEANDDDLRLPDESYGQLGFAGRDRQEFVDVAAYLAEKSGDALVRKRTARAADALSRAENGELEVLRIFYNQDDWTLSRRPALMGLDRTRIVKLALEDTPQLKAVGTLFAYRYHQLHVDSPLVDELEWARGTVADIMSGLATKVEPAWKLAGKRFEGLIRHYQTDDPSALRILGFATTDEGEPSVDEGGTVGEGSE